MQQLVRMPGIKHVTEKKSLYFNILKRECSDTDIPYFEIYVDP